MIKDAEIYVSNLGNDTLTACMKEIIGEGRTVDFYLATPGEVFQRNLKAAESDDNDQDAARLVAHAYALGHGVEKNLDLAVRWYSVASARADDNTEHQTVTVNLPDSAPQ